jgi:outer membrane protein assembly factor BamB
VRTADVARRLALLIATYEHEDSGLRRLTAPAHDAEALAGVLRDPEIAGFEVSLLVNEPFHRVGEAIGDFYRHQRRDDLTLLYFTGHGLKDDAGRLHLAMRNTRRDNLMFTSLSAEQVDRAMSESRSRQQVLILDCCYSGAFPTSPLAKGDGEVHALEEFKGRGRTVLTASDSAQYSFEGDEVHGAARQSLFTRFLVEGLRDGSADLDHDGDIALDELYDYVHDKVVEKMPQQRPKKVENVEGRIIIARNVNWTLPARIRDLLASPFPDNRVTAVTELARLHRVGNGRVRERVEQELRGLADDDSRKVSEVARGCLRERGLWAEPAPITGLVVASDREIVVPGPAPEPLPTAGRLRWRLPVEWAMSTRPAVANGLVYVGFGAKMLIAIDAATGEKRWQFLAGSAVRSSATVADGVLYVGSDDRHVHAIDSSTGQGMWSFKAKNPVRCRPVVVAGVVYVGDKNFHQYALDASTGRQRWWQNLGWSAIVSLAVCGKTLYFGTAGGSVYAVNVADGLKRWRRGLGAGVGAQLTVMGALVYFGGDAHTVRAVDTRTGADRWKFIAGGPVTKCPLAVEDGTVYAGSDDRHLYALDALTGHKRWAALTGGEIRSSPTVADGVVYVGSDDHRVYAFDAADGRKLWEYTTGGPVRSAPAVANGVVYVGSDDTYLYALNAAP